MTELKLEIMPLAHQACASLTTLLTSSVCRVTENVCVDHKVGSKCSLFYPSTPENEIVRLQMPEL